MAATIGRARGIHSITNLPKPVALADLRAALDGSPG
jgi:hypothetical protein